MNPRLNFSLTQIEYALAVLKAKSFGTAAKSLGVTQPTLSMQLQKLEESLNLRLFDRSTKPIKPTDDALKVLAQMQNVLFEANQIIELIPIMLGAEIAGDLKLGIIPTVAPQILPLALPRLEKIAPKLNLQIEELQTEQILEALERDEIDAGILAIPLNRAGFFETALFDEPFVLVCHPTHRMAKRDRIRQDELELQDLWLLEEGHCLRTQVLEICSRKKALGSPRVAIKSGSLETLKGIVESIGGCTLLPALSTLRLPKTLHQVTFVKPIPVRRIGIIRRREHLKSRLLAALESAIVSALPKSLLGLKEKDKELVPIS